MKEANGLTPEEFITSIYRAVLQREPDADGLATYLKQIRSGCDPAWLLRHFIESPESVARNFPPTYPLDNAPPMPVDLNYRAEDLAALWKHVGTVWSNFGEVDPYWSVVTDERFRTKNIHSEEILTEFYASGIAERSRLVDWLKRNNVILSRNMICAEYGCGVGRITKSLATMFKKVIAFDISAPHLQMAETYLRKQDINNVEYVLVRGAEDLERLVGVDLFYSMIVLQHNSPPIMVDILEHAFKGLQQGGAAFFQIPTYSKGYSFSLDQYWTETAEKSYMEMHFLPQRNIYELAHRHGTFPLETQPDWCVGHHGEWISNTFLMRKG